ncbi:hypothetical protein L1987_10501 [Smallanthus sonchifolius]|uniref:Uncharacterized protein n=1 Tax=Smallanthus sonchifolius TaxID=185202 RepID=A0ACB9JS97_9ASTR|nr:hypothetical protein L1987_10501 [Smallanthus sonchifolius]
MTNKQPNDRNDVSSTTSTSATQKKQYNRRYYATHKEKNKVSKFYIGDVFQSDSLIPLVGDRSIERIPLSPLQTNSCLMTQMPKEKVSCTSNEKRKEYNKLYYARCKERGKRISNGSQTTQTPTAEVDKVMLETLEGVHVPPLALLPQISDVIDQTSTLVENIDEDLYNFVYDVELDQRVYNRPTTSEVAGIWVEGNDNITSYKRSIVVYGRSECSQNIQPYFGCYDPLSYPLFFPNGESGWHSNIPRHRVLINEVHDGHDNINEETEDSNTRSGRKTVAMREYYCYKFQIQNTENVLLFGGRLLQQFAVDVYIKLETSRLQFYERNQAKIRADLYQEDLKEQLFKKHLIGEFKAYVYVIEFQKRGLPHANFLLIMHTQHKINNPDHYDKVVCAEIPDMLRHTKLHEIVAKHMIHGPCGRLQTNSPCMQGDPKSCRFRYLRQFNELTTQGDDAYPLYRRRNNEINVNVRGKNLDNRWVVPYNPRLLMMFNCHMNVEVCSSIKSVKYLFKYVYKGHDKQVIQIDPDEQWVVINEIKRFQDARYVSPPEAMWHIFSFSLSQIHPVVLALQFHLPNKQMVRFSDDDIMSEIVDREKDKKTMLTAFFETNRVDAAARQFLYKYFPKHFT